MMSGLTRHLAQIHIAQMREPLEHPDMRGFGGLLPRIQALADQSPGFVWRLETAEGVAAARRVFDDPLLLIHLSVWKNMESLHDYVDRSDHLISFRDRQRWFDPTPEPHMALWWIPPGSRPTVEEGKARLEKLGRLGPTAESFSFARPFTPAGEPRETGTFEAS